MNESLTEVSRETLILELARCLHASGSPAYELDQRMEQVAASLDKPAMFFSTPTALFVTFEDEGAATRLLRVYPGDTNLGRYAALYELQRAIQEENLSATAAWDRLKEIESLPNGYSPFVQIAAVGVTGSGVAVLVGGNAAVITTAGALSLIVGALFLVLAHRNYPTHLINVIAGFIVSAIACLIQAFVASSNFELISVCALIVLVPGLHLTISINELATQNLASGSARFAGAMTTLLTLVFGVYMGYGLVDALVSLPKSAAPHIPTVAASIAATLPIGICLAVLFRARRRDIGWVLLSTLVAYTTLRLAGELVSPIAAVWIAAVVSGLSSRIVSSWRKFPAAVTLMPALILLVPGSLGFSGMSQIMLSEDLPSGIRLIATMMLTAGAIVAGLLLSDVIVPIRTARTK